MKILQVSKFLVRRGGVETYLLDLGSLLENAGHEVQYFGMDDPNKLVGNKWGIYAPAMELGGAQGLDRVRDIGRSIDSVENGRRMARLLDAFQPDIVHFNNIHYHLTPSVIRAAFEYKSRSNHPVSHDNA